MREPVFIKFSNQYISLTRKQIFKKLPAKGSDSWRTKENAPHCLGTGEGDRGWEKQGAVMKKHFDKKLKCCFTAENASQ